MKPLHALALDWAIRCFGSEHVSDLPTRALRTAEEAVELAQACGVGMEKMFDLVRVVYSRPRGSPVQEIGGIMLTVAVLCAVRGYDPDELFLTELRRVLDKPADHFAKRNQDKLDMGLKA